MPAYVLPDLPYDYGALEPHISGRIMELHHGKHHAAYVANANAVLEQLEEARAREDFSRLALLERSLAFNISGHVLHSLFWRNLAPAGGGEPDGALGEAIRRDLGGFRMLKKQMTGAAVSLMGSGWAALVWEPSLQSLLVSQIYDHHSNVAQGSIPLMVIDGWEHAYYLQYQNRKTEFFDAVWNLWNWKDIGERLGAARR